MYSYCAMVRWATYAKVQKNSHVVILNPQSMWGQAWDTVGQVGSSLVLFLSAECSRGGRESEHD